MNILGIPGLMEGLFNVLDRVLPDKAARDEAKLKLLELQQAGEFKQIDALVSGDQGQVSINVEEAKSDNLFKSGWRPFIGWVCGSSLAYQYIGHPMLEWFAAMNNVAGPPKLDLADLITILLGMLGLGAYRTFEKKNGVA